MKIVTTYDYLTHARRDLWSTLESAPNEVLARDLVGGPRFHCVKDLLFHIPDVEDGWINGDIRGGQLLQASLPALQNAGPDFSGFALDTLVDYWRQVEASTLAWMSTLRDADLEADVHVDDWPEKKFTVDSLLSHVMIHEMRHTAQVALLLRMQGIKPPALDLLFYLP